MIIAFIGGAVCGFIFGSLFARRNLKKVETAVDALETVGKNIKEKFDKD